MMKRILALASAATLAVACGSSDSWTAEEKALIDAPDMVMRVLTVDDAQDSLVLRRNCGMLAADVIADGRYSLLADKMLATVTSPEQDGVGIAGPQVGISRRIVAVMRYDKEGRPFEVFPNIEIVDRRGGMEPGPEGCLSVPGRRGDVMRYREIDIRYTSPATLRDTVETVTGYTAVIFQHECDHLDGILYTDYL